MISVVIGQIVEKAKNKIIVLTSGGVGYEVFVKNTLFLDLKIGQKVQLCTYLKVSESAMDLYGFENSNEKEFFEILISVKGVGPKGAMNILSLGAIDEIKKAVVNGDATYLNQVNGIGKKTAERMVVELKNKIVVGKDVLNSGSVDGEKLGEVVEGLVAIGYSKEEARLAIKDLDTENKTSEEILKFALRQLSR